MALLFPHQDIVYEDQVVYVTGHGYLRCEFHRCTMVVVGAPNSAFRECRFHGCLWHINLIVGTEAEMDDLDTLLPVVRRTLIPKDAQQLQLPPSDAERASGKEGEEPGKSE